MTEKIFVSYAHEDRELAKNVEHQLREYGILTTEDVDIVDPLDELKGGENIRDAVRSQMKAADMVVIIASKNSVNSKWVNYEAGMASALEKPVVILAEPGLDKGLLLNTFHDVRLIEVEAKNS
jgi:nucleoside 2-deoxyribosyltransferase